jgi:MFS family permease
MSSGESPEAASLPLRGVGALALARTFRSLRHRDFRLLWFGVLGSLTGYWVHFVAQGWLVYELTGSAFLLGVVGAAGSLPSLLFALVGGVLADRVDRRRLLIVTRLFYAVLAALLTMLTATGLITVWQLAVIAFLAGTVLAFDMPTRQALVPSLVGGEDLPNAVALVGMAFNGTRVIGPAIAGTLLASLGATWCFALTVVGHVAMVIMLLLMRSTPPPLRAARSLGVMRSLGEAFAYIWRTPRILGTLTIATVVSLFGMPYVTFLPIFAEEYLGVGAPGLGMLVTATGIGATASLLTLATAREVRHRGKLTLYGAGAFGLLVVAFALSRSFWLALILLALVGAMTSASFSSAATVLQGEVPDALRGRVMSVYILTWGLVPLGQLGLGALAEQTGVAVAVALGGLVCAVLAVVIWWRVPSLRREVVPVQPSSVRISSKEPQQRVP